MHKVIITGGLGNQMFQYAFALALSKHYKDRVILDTSWYNFTKTREYQLGAFNISLDLGYTLVNNDTLVQEVYNIFDPTVFDYKKNIVFKGYWQSEKYFIKYKDLLKLEFTLKKELHKKSEIYKKMIIKTESISIHIRRTDYVTHPYTNRIHGTCSIAYYQEAISILKKTTNNPYFFIFSDNLDWAKENLDNNENMIFVELDQNIPDYEEIILMSLCKHNIIANSSFSWWGAWLNQNPNKIIIAPEKWFNDDDYYTRDLIPREWIAI
jgi:hypothetical protein